MKSKVRFLFQEWKVSPTLFIFYVLSLGLFKMDARGVYLATIFFYDNLALVFICLYFANGMQARYTKKVFRV